MPATIEGKPVYPSRYRSGLFGFDVALGNPRTVELGFPGRAVYEIYGKQGRGKSTLALYLAGVIRPEGRIVYQWLESVDPSYLLNAVGQAGFDGAIKLIDHYDADQFDQDGELKADAKPRSHEEMFGEADALCWEPQTNAYILDSIAQTRSTAMREGDYGEAYWGQRAKFVNQHASRLEGIVNDRPGPGLVAILLNHVHVDMGNKMNYTAYITPGGVGKEYASVARIHLKTADPKSVGKIEGAEITKGTVEKLRYGGAGREFHFVLLPGQGVSAELTAVIDCVALGLAERGTTVSIKGTGKAKGKSIGRLSDLVQAAIERDTDRFEPFVKELEQYEHENYKPE